MRRVSLLALVITLAFSSLFVGRQVIPASADNPTILMFNTMVGVPPTLTGAQSLAPLRGIAGGGLPWTLSSGVGVLKANGQLVIIVHGLVLAAGSLAGTNPVASFAAIVSCVNSDGTFDNILTASFPATTGPASLGGGDAQFVTQVTLPQTCIAPIVFVTSPGGHWFAVNGN